MSDPLPPAVVQRDPIEYLINAMELAGQHPRPFEQGYVTKRHAVLDAIAALRTRAETAERERDEWRDATVRERIAADIKAAYQRGIGRSPRIVLRHAEAAHMALQEVDRD